MNPALAQWGPVAVVMGGYLLGIYFQDRRINDLKDSLNKRLDDMNGGINKRFDDMRDLIKSEIRRVEDRIERLEHPIVRQ